MHGHKGCKNATPETGTPVLISVLSRFAADGEVPLGVQIGSCTVSMEVHEAFPSLKTVPQHLGLRGQAFPSEGKETERVDKLGTCKCKPQQPNLQGRERERERGGGKE